MQQVGTGHGRSLVSGAGSYRIIIINYQSLSSCHLTQEE